MNKKLDIILANPRGFCAGVERAIEIVEKALKRYGPPVFVRHEIVHNKHVVKNLRNKGAIFVGELDEIPDGGVAIFSAHGVAQSVEEEANRRSLPVIDATCPLVSKVHKEGQNHAAKNRQVILIGHDGHPEVEGTRGRIPGGVLLVNAPKDVEKLEVKDPDSLSYITQTTLSVDETRETINALRTRFPNIIGPDVKDICYATQNRQEAVHSLSTEADLVLVLGSQNSSNSQRLRELAEEKGIQAHLIDEAADMDDAWFSGQHTVVITAGASAPESVVQECVTYLQDRYHATLEERVIRDENVFFPLPKELRVLGSS